MQRFEEPHAKVRRAACKGSKSRLRLASRNLVTPAQSRISRTPYPQFGGPTLSQGPKIQSRHHLNPKESFESPN